MNRIDCLGPRPERRVLFRGDVLARDVDQTLQGLVEDAAQGVGTPIALVSLVLDRTQLFRASVGLPEDLELAKGTDRDVSFCQLVVRDEALIEVNDAPNDERVPQDLVERYGIKAYLGAPLRMEDGVAGSLCVIDTEARAFGAEDRALLERLAAEAAVRLEELAGRERASSERTTLASTPAFAELRNQLQGLGSLSTVARMALAEIAPVVELTTRWQGPDRPAALDALTNSCGALEALRDVIGELDTFTEQVQANVLAVEQLVLPGDGAQLLSSLVHNAVTLSTHATKLIGGVEVEGLPHRAVVVGSRPVLIGILSCAFVSLANACQQHDLIGGMRIRVESIPGEYRLRLGAPGLPSSAYERVQRQIAEVTGGETRATLEHDGVTLHLPAVVDAALVSTPR